MFRYDRVDEAVIDLEPQRVWDLLVAELRGAAQWWTPHNTFEPNLPGPEVVGGSTRFVVHARGSDKRGPKLRFTARTNLVEAPWRLAADIVDGAFRGRLEFVLRAVEPGPRTHVAMLFSASPHGPAAILARLADIDGQHSQAVQDAFSSLGLLVRSPPGGPAAVPVNEARAVGRA